MITSQLPNLPKDFDRAVRILLSESGRPLLQEIHRSLKADNQYLFYHGIGVNLEIDRLLHQHGIEWSPAQLERFRLPALRLALQRLQPHSA
jgi:hypothetical protein